MKFARWVFTIAGIWGLLVVTPLVFLFDTISRENPPAITHPEFYYGFTAVTLAWQFAFLVIASDPIRFRSLMAVAVVEKAGWVATVGALYAQGRIGANALPITVADLLLGVLFVVSFVKTASERYELVSIPS